MRDAFCLVVRLPVGPAPEDLNRMPLSKREARPIPRPRSEANGSWRFRRCAPVLSQPLASSIGVNDFVDRDRRERGDYRDWKPIMSWTLGQLQTSCDRGSFGKANVAELSRNDRSSPHIGPLSRFGAAGPLHGHSQPNSANGLLRNDRQYGREADTVFGMCARGDRHHRSSAIWTPALVARRTLRSGKLGQSHAASG